jgi:predicted secreted protein
MAFYAGKEGSFTLGGVTYKMRDWQLSVEYSRIDVTNFESTSDWREFLNGFASGTISAKGPYDPTQATPSAGSSLAFVCKVGSTYQFTGNAYITKISFTQNIEGAGEISIEGAITGSVDLDLSA